MADDRPASAEEDAASSAAAAAAIPPAHTPHGSPTQDRLKRPALDATGVPRSPARDLQEHDAKREPEDTSSDAAIALAAAGGSNQSYRARKPNSPTPAAPEPAAVSAAAVSPVAALAPDVKLADNLFELLPFGQRPDVVQRHDYEDADKFGEVPEPKLKIDAPLNQSLRPLAIATIASGLLKDRTALWVTAAAIPSKAHPRSGRDAVAAALDLLEIVDTPQLRVSELYNDCYFAQIQVKGELPKSAKTPSGFQAAAQESLREVHILLKFRASTEPLLSDFLPADFKGDFKLNDLTEKNVTHKVLDHLRNSGQSLTPISSVATLLHAMVTDRKNVHHTAAFPNLPLSAFTLGPLSGATTQSAVSKLLSAICRVALPMVLRCENKTLDKALVIIPSRYSAPNIVRRLKAGVTVAYRNDHSVCSPATDKLQSSFAAERQSAEAAAAIFFAHLRFPNHFALRKLTRKRVCIRCLSGSHSASSCTGTEVCRQCSAIGCHKPCAETVQCGICGAGHVTSHCAEYRGQFVVPTDDHRDLPGRGSPVPALPVNFEPIGELLQSKDNEQLQRLLTKQRQCWVQASTTADEHVIGKPMDSPEPEHIKGLWTALKPTKALLDVAQATLQRARATGGRGLARVTTTVPLTATLAKQHIAKVQELDIDLKRLVLSGASDRSCCSKSDLPALPPQLVALGLSIDNCWSYDSPTSASEVLSPSPLGPSGRRNGPPKGVGSAKRTKANRQPAKDDH